MFSSQWWKIYFWGRAYLEYNEEHKTTQSVCSEKQTCQKGTCFSSFFLNLLTVLTRIFVRCVAMSNRKMHESFDRKKRKKYLSNFNLTLMIRTVWSKGHFFRTERNISNKKIPLLSPCVRISIRNWMQERTESTLLVLIGFCSV